MAYKREGGALTNKDQHVYIRRGAEEDLKSALLNMDYVRIIGPRQMGKSSLLNFLLRWETLPKSLKIALVSLEGFPVASEADWYQSLAQEILRQFTFLPEAVRLPLPQDGQTWRNFLYRISREAYQQEFNLVLALDEVGHAIHLPQSEQFFALLRSIHESRQRTPEFSHLTFILTGAFNPQHLIKNPDASPFNIGIPLDLVDFTADQVSQLLHKGCWSGPIVDQLAQRVFFWTDGHPFQSHWLCAFLEKETARRGSDKIDKEDVDNGIEKLLMNPGVTHFHSLINELKKASGLQNYVLRVLNHEKLKMALGMNPDQYQLWLDGVIKEVVTNDGKCLVRIRNRIYERVLQNAFMP